MNKWEKLLLLKSRPNCDANCVLSQSERAQKTYLWCQGTRLINFSNKTAYNFLTFVIAGWFTLETKNVLTQILRSYLQERKKNEKITLLFMETLACFYETYASIFLISQCSICYEDNPPSPNPKITFASNFEQNVGWRAVLVKQSDLFCF